MPRKRSQVKEDVSELKRIEADIAGSRREPAIRMLRFLAESPDRTLSEVADIMNRPERTVRRWWQFYLAGGLDALLQAPPAGGQRPSKLTPEELAAFRVRAASGFSELKEAQQWLVKEYGVSYSLGRVSELLNERISPMPTLGVPAVIAVHNDTTSVSANVDLVSFLNALPNSTDPVEWIQGFSNLLMGLFTDVDRISINLNILGRLYNEHPVLRFIQHVADEESEKSLITCIPYNPDVSPSQRLLEDFKTKGSPVHLYQSPATFDYFTHAGDYLGSLIVWRSLDCTPISTSTLGLIEQLRPFIDFALTDAVARSQCFDPTYNTFHVSLARLRDEARLTIQEYRIVALRVLGHSYRDIAEMLSVSVGTIKKHLNSVHHKSNTRSQTELFARYFSTRKWA